MRAVAISATVEDACAKLVEDGLAHAVSTFVVTGPVGEETLQVFSSTWRYSVDYSRFVRAVRESGSEFGRAMVRGDITEGSTVDDHEDPFVAQWVVMRQEDRRFVVACFDDVAKQQQAPTKKRRREGAAA